MSSKGLREGECTAHGLKGWVQVQIGVKELTQSPINHSMFHLSLTAHQASEDRADCLSRPQTVQLKNLHLSFYLFTYYRQQDEG